MGSIRTEVRDQHLSYYPDEEIILKPFLPCFFVTWGRLRKAYNTELSVYFLSPEASMTDIFGFEQEIMLVYSKYNKLEPRSVQAAEAIIADDPARGRVEKLSYYFVSEDPNTERWFQSYTAVNQESRLIIPFYADDLRKNLVDSWYVRNKTGELLYGRDLFDFRLPLEKDTYFFGRTDLTINLFDAIKRSENRGVFGLRKTGKTSLLFKLERLVKAENVAELFFFDCKLPSIRKLRWFELLERICGEITSRYKLKSAGVFNELNASDRLLNIISNLNKPALLVFDEIEYISPVSIDDQHWHKDFVDFWQTFWACQSRYRKISTMIAGVNPSVVEMDTINGIQNPLFGIVSYEFLTGLKAEETRNMLHVLGKRMGLKFDFNASNYIHDRYGGHPLLVRMASSAINKSIKARKEKRPTNLIENKLREDEEKRDSDLVFYCRHVVSELKQFYPDEYEMLELLASGQVHDYNELAAFPEYVQHLTSYGLINEGLNSQPTIAIPVIGRYVGLELAREEGRQTIYKIIPKEDRGAWLEKRIKAILTDIRLLERAIKTNKGVPLFGANSFPVADEFACISVVETDKQFLQFVSICNKCFVESIENYGNSIGNNKYYWKNIKTAYPGLWHSLQRIKIYRHENVHLTLTTNASNELLTYLKQDLEGKSASEVKDANFVLQQCVLDGLLTGIQIEINKLT